MRMISAARGRISGDWGMNFAVKYRFEIYPKSVSVLAFV
jgi:hypothetical protein